MKLNRFQDRCLIQVPQVNDEFVRVLSLYVEKTQGR
jgi:hypothetical protein